MRQCPRQNQWKLLARHVFQSMSIARVPQNRHPLRPGWLLRKEAATPTRPILAQIHLIELHNNSQRHSDSWIVRPWIASLRPNETTNCAHGAIHKTSLHPQIHGQQHPRALAQLQAIPKAAMEVVTRDVLHLDATIVLGLLVRSANRSNGLAQPPRNLAQLNGIQIHRPLLAILTLLLAIHQKHPFLRSFNLPTPFWRLAQVTHVPPGKPFMVLNSPGQIRHPVRHLHVSPPFQLVPFSLHRTHISQHSVCFEGTASNSRSMNPPKQHDIVELQHSQSATLRKLFVAWIHRFTVRPSVDSLASVGASFEDAVVADGLGLIAMTGQNHVQTSKRHIPDEVTRNNPEDLVCAMQHLPEHSATNHGELIQNGQAITPKALLHLPDLVRVKALPDIRVDRENAVSRRGAVLHLKRRAPGRSSKDATLVGVLDTVPSINHQLPLGRHDGPDTPALASASSARENQAQRLKVDELLRIRLHPQLPLSLHRLLQSDVVRKPLPGIQLRPKHLV